MKKTTVALLLLAGATTIQSCGKDDTAADPATLKKEIIVNAASTVCEASYKDLATKSAALLTAVTTLNATSNETNLTAARNAWKDIRTTWERSEAWLFGPVSTDNIDPRIDTWPVDFNALQSIVDGSATLNEAYIDGLDDALKGFHPIEFLLWGSNGTKAATALTTREKQYLLALAQNLNTLATDVKNSWVNNYTAQLTATAVDANNRVSSYVEIADAMAGICDEVANGKLKDPYDAQDATLEESPFAKNSVIDFTNNINGILDMYQGKFNTDGAGIEDLVRYYNLSLDAEIKAKHAAAVASLQAISVPFGQAIVSQRSLVNTAMIRINDLASSLETLSLFLQQYGK